MTRLSPDARAVVAAVDRLTTQVRRLADAQQTGVTDTDDAPTTTADDGRAIPPGRNAEDCPRCRPEIDKTVLYPWICPGHPTPAADDDAQRTTRRQSLRIILDRASRGVILRSDEAALLRQHVAAEQRDADTARADLEQAQAAIERVRTQATTQRARGASGSTDHKIGLYDAAVAILAALDGTEQPTTKG